MIRCQKCGYTNQSNAKKCIKCQSSLVEEGGTISNGMDTSVDIKFNQKNNDQKKTIQRRIPGAKSAQLVALSEDQKELKALPIKGDAMLLTRELLDAENNTLSRKGHAELVLKDGAWYLDNVSELKTTFIQVNRPYKLADGDIILLGDSLFKFKENS